MSTFSINIDATNLIYRQFIIPGKTGWVDSKIIQKLDLELGSYSFQVASGTYAHFTFNVTSKGTVDWDDSRFDAFLSGKGSPTLIIKGFTVILDARYLSGSGVLLVIPATTEDWITYKICKMVPGTYQVQQGSGEVTSFNFTLGLDGKLLYDDPSHDIENDGFLAIKTKDDISILEFLGYPILVDARAAGGAGLTIQPIWGMPFTFTAVQFANLLPAQSFTLQINSGVLTRATFSLDVHGNFTFDNSLSPYLDLQTFHGLKMLKVKAPLP